MVYDAHRHIGVLPAYPLVEWYADRVPVHLVHFGGGMSGHIKLIGSRFLEWIERGKRVYTDLSWAIGFAPAWLAREIERRGLGHDRVLFASDQPWGDFEGEYARNSPCRASGWTPPCGGRTARAPATTATSSSTVPAPPSPATRPAPTPSATAECGSARTTPA